MNVKTSSLYSKCKKEEIETLNPYRKIVERNKEVIHNFRKKKQTFVANL